jgi:multiple sugar transport system substrate-binding protein
LTSGDQYGVYFDYVSATGNIMFQNLLETADGRLIKDAKHVAFNSPEGIRAVQYWRDLQTVDKSMPNLTRDQADQSFLAGKIAMYVVSGSRLGFFTQNAKFKLKTAMYPSADGTTRKVVASGNSLMILAKDAKKQAAAWDFIKFATSPQGTSLFAQSNGYMALRKSALETANLMGDYLKNNPNARTTYDQVNDFVPWTIFPGSNGYRIDALLKDKIVAAVQGQIPVEQALRDAETQANALLQ